MNSSQAEYSTVLDDINDFITFPVGMFGFFMNIISVLVLAQPALKGVTFQYMLSGAISDTIISALYALSLLSNCQKFCNIDTTFGAQFYSHYLYYYGGNCLELFTSLIEITLALDRLFAITGFTRFRKIRSMYIQLGLLTFSALFNLPFVLAYKITSSPVESDDSRTNETIRELIFSSNEQTEFGASQAGLLTITILSVFRGVFLVIILVLINAIMIKNLSKHIKKKKSMIYRSTTKTERSVIFTVETSAGTSSRSFATNSTRSRKTRSEIGDRNITKMVIYLCFLALIGNFPLALSFVYDFFDPKSTMSKALTILANSLDAASHSAVFFVYYKFNILFKKSCLSLLKKLQNLLSSTLDRK